MKSHLTYTFTRLALVALLICGSGLKARGHDLPQDRNLPPAASANCFVSFSVESLPLSDKASPWLHALKSLWSSASQSASSLQSAIHNLSSQLADPINLSVNSLAIHAPDPGIAPRPRLASAGNLSDSSLEHAADILLVHLPAPGMPPRPRVGHAQQSAFDLALLLSQLDYWQCQISQTLYDQDALQQAIADHTQRSYRLLDRTLASCGPLWQSSPDQTTRTAGPLFVAFDTAAGKRILLTVAQARQWKFAAPAAEPNAADWLNTALIPLQRQAVWTLSQNLELAGNKLLQLSRSISTLAPAKVAGQLSGNQWK